MPPRLQPLVNAAQAVTRTSYQPLAPFLYPFLLGQQRCASILSSLSDVKSSYNKRIRRGRGPASGKGKTSGRGHKGQGQHGKVPYKFNGGQTPDIVVSGEHGFENAFHVEMAPINLNRIQAWIDKGRIDPSKPITMRELNSSRCVHGVKEGIKLLARGKEELRSKITIVVSRASAEAIAAVEAAGGTVITRFYSKFAIRKILLGEMDPINSFQSRIHLDPAFPPSDPQEYEYRLPDPASRKDIEYYRDHAHRGYLSYTVGEGESPSLFFKTPGPWKRSHRLANIKQAEDAAKPSSDAEDANEQTGDIVDSIRRSTKKADEMLW